MKCSGTSCTSTSKPASPTTQQAGGAGVERNAGALSCTVLDVIREVGSRHQAAGCRRELGAIATRFDARASPAGAAQARVEPADRQDEARPVTSEAGAQGRRTRSPGNLCASRESTSTWRRSRPCSSVEDR